MIEYKNYDSFSFKNTVEPFGADSSPSNSIVEDVGALVMIIFNEAPYILINGPNKSVTYARKFVIQSMSGKVSDEFDDTKFKGGMRITAQKIKIYIQNSDHSQRVFLPDRITHNLLDFILKGYSSSEYCCIDFVQQMYGLFKPEFISEIAKEWIALPIDASSLKKLPLGAAIMLADLVGEQGMLFKHFAMALGSDLYISLLGDNGIVGIMEFDQMQACYQASSTYCLIERSCLNVDISSLPLQTYHNASE